MKIRKKSRDKALDKVEKCNITDSSILELKSLKIIQEEYSSGIRKGPSYLCNICHKCEYWVTLLIFD